MDGADDLTLTDARQQNASDLPGNGTDRGGIHYPRAATIFASVCCVIFILVGIIGNLLTIVALSRSIKLRVHATTAFVVSLCVSDLLFCSINLPLTASRYISEAWLLGETACKLFPFFFYSNVAASLLNMAAIAINRYVMVWHSRLYKQLYRFPCIVAMVVAVWIFSFSMMVLPLTEVWGRLGLNERTFSCTILKKDGKSPKKFLFAFGILLPCVIIVTCYLLIFIRIRRGRQNIRTHSEKVERLEGAALNAVDGPGREAGRTSTTLLTQDLRITRMMLIIFLAFIACFIPLMLVNVFDDDDVRYPSLHVVASVLAWMSAVINPFIYAVSNRQYRSAYRRLLCGSSVQRPAGVADSRTFVTDVFQYNALTGRAPDIALKQDEAK